MKALLALLFVLAALPGAAQSPEPEPADVGWHVVQPGETLHAITAHYLGSAQAWQENWRLNPGLEDPHRLRPGQRIRVLLSMRQPSATIASIARRVDQKVRGDAWSHAQLGQTLRERDGVRTGEKSSAALRFDDGADLVLAETSIVFLRRLGARLEGVERQTLEIVEGQADVARATPAAVETDLEIIIGPTTARTRTPAGAAAQLRNRRAGGIL